MYVDKNKSCFNAILYEDGIIVLYINFNHCSLYKLLIIFLYMNF